MTYTYRRAEQPAAAQTAKARRTHTLPDGTFLHSPEPRQARELQIGWWVRVDDEPWLIRDMRFRNGDGKVIHLAGHSPLVLNSHETVPVYSVRPSAVPSPRKG